MAPYNTDNIDTSKGETMKRNVWKTETPNLYSMSKSNIQQKISDVWQQYSQAVSEFNPQDIADEQRLKHWWTYDLDQKIEKVKNKYSTSWSDLRKEFANVENPRRRNELIEQRRGTMRTELTNLLSAKEYRLWTLKDITNREIEDKKVNLKKLQAQYNLYKDVMWDIEKAEKIQREMDKQGQEMELKYARLWLEQKRFKDTARYRSYLINKSWSSSSSSSQQTEWENKENLIEQWRKQVNRKRREWLGVTTQNRIKYDNLLKKTSDLRKLDITPWSEEMTSYWNTTDESVKKHFIENSGFKKDMDFNDFKKWLTKLSKNIYGRKADINTQINLWNNILDILWVWPSKFWWENLREKWEDFISENE